MTMIFVLGIITGLLIAVVVALTTLFFRHPIHKVTTIIEKNIGNVGPRPKGFIVDPPTDAEESRANIIAKNRREGRDTPISDLE